MSDISSLFALDPHQLTKEDLSQIIQHYRDHRKQFVQNGEAPVRKTKAGKNDALLNEIGSIKL